MLTLTRACSTHALVGSPKAKVTIMSHIVQLDSMADSMHIKLKEGKTPNKGRSFARIHLLLLS